ncbi:hypothetical protein VN97_g9458 [Penicillium thymicola]|uniref:Uncharacterized protein n=1 Tax=Penicillium thymicola TaxID=293382 RepID=A0AAI9TBK6_PENTH|nr:hypothetical protein VN97_g9458 [Penicillium thymicola]
MSVMTSFVSFVSFVSLNHPVVHKFHGPTPIAACQSKALGLYYREYRGDRGDRENCEYLVAFYSSRYSALEINDLVSGQTTFRFTFSTPPRCLLCHEPPKRKYQANPGKKKKKMQRKRDDLCRLHKIHIILI